MTILGLDTAGRTAAVGIVRSGELLYEGFVSAGHTHSETLLPLVDTALAAAGLGPADIELWGVCAGPGSFTGLRIGLAAVKGLAFVHGAPCAAVPTLQALAYSCPPGQGTVLAALDARRGEVYWAAFDLADHSRLTPDAAAPLAALADFIKNCKKPLFFVGDGAGLCYNGYGFVPGVVPCPPALRTCRGAGVALAAGAMQKAGQCVPAAQLQPCYLRLSQAERERLARGQALQP